MAKDFNEFKKTNAYTILFSIIMVIVVGSLLAFTANSLRPRQKENVENEKRQNILNSVGIKIDRDEAAAKFKEVIKKQVAVNTKGEVVAEGEEVFDIDLAKELARPSSERQLPLFEAEVDGEEVYIVPLQGAGLWGAIWGFMSLKKDFVIQGVVYDHASETPGLGAEITEPFFTDRFKGEKIVDQLGRFSGIKVVKDGSGGTTSDEGAKVDAISGATITVDGVSKMVNDCLKMYMPYFGVQVLVN